MVAFFPDFAAARVRALPNWARFVGPATLSIPYLLVACEAGVFRWGWLALYMLAPVAVALLLAQAARVDADQRGNDVDGSDQGHCLHCAPFCAGGSRPASVAGERGLLRDFLQHIETMERDMHLGFMSMALTDTRPAFLKFV